MEVDKKLVGLRIKQFRINKGYTLLEFGEFFGAGKSNVQGWEKGLSLPNKDRLVKISKLMGVSVNELLYGDEDAAILKLRESVRTLLALDYTEKEIIELVREVKE